MQQIEGAVNCCDQSMSFYRIPRKQEMVVGSVQWVS